MAIKIKKKDGSTTVDEEPELLDEDGAPVGSARPVSVGAGGDPFVQASWQTASWIEENRGIVFGGIVVVFLAVLGGYLGLSFLEDQKVEASTSMIPAFDSYNTLIEGSPELEALKSTPGLTAPDKTFESNTARWQAVYDDANKALTAHPTGDIAYAAKLTKAAAALELGKFDEAAALYEEYRKAAPDEAMKPIALQGLATVYASSEKWDQAIAALDELAGEAGYERGAKYQKARILERSGKAEDAKTLFHAILDEDPMHPQKDDIERRLANM